MSTLTATVSGSGFNVISGVTIFQINSVRLRLTAVGSYVDIDGTTSLQRIHHAGFVGVCEVDVTLAPEVIWTWSYFVQRMIERVIMHPGITANAYGWDLTPGVSVEIIIDYT